MEERKNGRVERMEYIIKRRGEEERQSGEMRRERNREGRRGGM